VGTGPFRLEAWSKGSSVTLARWDGYRAARDIKLRRVQMRFISDPAAQVASLLSGDVDVFPRVSAAKSLKQFEGDRKYQVLIGGSRAKTILAMNNKRKPLDDVRLRRAIYAAIDRKAVIEGAADGFGTPIGSYYVPGAPGYIDTTDLNPFDQAKAPRAAAPGRHHAAAGTHDEASAHALRAPGRRGHRRAARQGRHQREDRERGVGAVAVGRLRPEGLRPDRHLPRGAAGLRQLRRARTTTGATSRPSSTRCGTGSAPRSSPRSATS
jgi:hypothetical protein